MGYGNLIVVIILGFMASLLLTSVMIPILKNKQMGQNIREEGPESHKKKAGVPTMGGIAIVLGTIIAAGIGGFISADTVVLAIGFLGFGAIGFLDDYIKAIKKRNLGLRAYQKIVLQLIFAIGISCYIAYFTPMGTELFVPFAKVHIDFGAFYVPFSVFAILAIVNAVNLTDGLDGLASGVTIMVAIVMAVIAMINDFDSVSIFSIALAGALLGFLIYNKYPAKVFMGDTGSLALGGGIITAALIMKMPLILPIIGIVYLLEALSVCIQVTYFKMTGGKRVFKMTPLHHHFELSGMNEVSVVLMFCGVTLIACIIGSLGVF